jgi:hypothetical protein
MRAFSMLKLTRRLCLVSADMFWSKMDRERGGARLLLFWRCEPNDERRKSVRLPARLEGRNWLGEKDLCPSRDDGRDLECASWSSNATTCFCKAWARASASNTEFSRARICDWAADKSRACCCLRELSSSASSERGVPSSSSGSGGEDTASRRRSTSSSRAFKSARRDSISF